MDIAEVSLRPVSQAFRDLCHTDVEARTPNNPPTTCTSCTNTLEKRVLLRKGNAGRVAYVASFSFRLHRS